MEDEHLHDMTRGYITAALWSDAERLCGCAPKTDVCDCEARKESGGLEGLEVRAEDYLYIRDLCERFAKDAGGDLDTFAELRSFDPSEGSVWSYIGHDLRLTSAGHGTGFWDREPAGEAATLRNAFFGARTRLSELASTKPYDRTSGGDVWQEDEHTCHFEWCSLEWDGAPGERWEPPSLTSAQRQCWIETGEVPDVNDTHPIGP